MEQSLRQGKAYLKHRLYYRSEVYLNSFVAGAASRSPTVNFKSTQIRRAVPWCRRYDKLRKSIFPSADERLNSLCYRGEVYLNSFVAGAASHSPTPIG